MPRRPKLHVDERGGGHRERHAGRGFERRHHSQAEDEATSRPRSCPAVQEPYGGGHDDDIVGFETDDIGFTCALVNAGLAVALMPELLLRSVGARIYAVPTRPALPPRRISVAYRASAERLGSVREVVAALEAAVGADKVSRQAA